MSGRRASELCPQLTFVGGHFSEYQRLGDFKPLVERISIDEASPMSPAVLNYLDSLPRSPRPFGDAFAKNSACRSRSVLQEPST